MGVLAEEIELEVDLEIDWQTPSEKLSKHRGPEQEENEMSGIDYKEPAQ